MKILLINHYAGSLNYGMEFRPFYLSREWVRNGHEVLIVAASCSHLRTNQPTMIDTIMDEQIENVKYRWYSTPKYKSNGIGRFLNICSFLKGLWSDSRWIANTFKPDVVIASSTYPMDIWPARRIAKYAKAKLIYEVHDLWPLSPIEFGNMSRWNPFIVWVQMAEDYACRNADRVISILPKTSEYLQSRGMLSKKFAHIPNGVDEQDWTKSEPLPPEVAKCIQEMKNIDLPIVAYTGSHNIANSLDILLDAAHQFKGKAQVILVGTGLEKDRLLSRVIKERLSHVVMLSPLPKLSIPALLSQIDIAYIGYKPVSLHRFGISMNKLADYMMAGKPVIQSIKAGNDPVKEAGCGITVPPGDASAVADAVLKLATLSAEKRDAIGQAGKKFILANQTYPILAKRFIKEIIC